MAGFLRHLRKRMSHAMIWSLAQPHDHGYLRVDVNLVNNMNVRVFTQDRTWFSETCQEYLHYTIFKKELGGKYAKSIDYPLS